MAIFSIEAAPTAWVEALLDPHLYPRRFADALLVPSVGRVPIFPLCCRARLASGRAVFPFVARECLASGRAVFLLAARECLATGQVVFSLFSREFFVSGRAVFPPASGECLVSGRATPRASMGPIVIVTSWQCVLVPLTTRLHPHCGLLSYELMTPRHNVRVSVTGAMRPAGECTRG